MQVSVNEINTFINFFDECVKNGSAYKEHMINSIYYYTSYGHLTAVYLKSGEREELYCLGFYNEWLYYESY